MIITKNIFRLLLAIVDLDLNRTFFQEVCSQIVDIIIELAHVEIFVLFANSIKIWTFRNHFLLSTSFGNYMISELELIFLLFVILLDKVYLLVIEGLSERRFPCCLPLRIKLHFRPETGMPSYYF